MAHSEACQLFIEQQIEEALQEGKTPYSIGKDLASWVEKVFEAKIPPHTLEVRAHRAKDKILTNVSTCPSNEDDSEMPENQAEVEHGGKRKGAGRPPKYQPGPKDYAAEAMQYANMAISQLERIRREDPYGTDALEKVSAWITKELS
jgi:hypothetical protein